MPEGGGRYRPAEQVAHARALAAEALSLAGRELWSDPALERDIAAFVAALAERGALVQYIVYDLGDLMRLKQLHAEGAIPQREPHVVLFVLES